MTKTSSQQTSVTETDVSSGLVTDDLRIINQSLPYHTRLNPPKKVKFKSEKPSKVQESPLDARSPQEVLEYHGMYKDPSIYKENPTKIYADLTAFDDFQTMQNAHIQAERKFRELPVEVRAKFNHDVTQFANYVSSPSFDIKEVLDSESYQALEKYKAQEKQQADYEAYLKTDEYKQKVQEELDYQAFKKSQFENWKNSRK